MSIRPPSQYLRQCFSRQTWVHLHPRQKPHISVISYATFHTSRTLHDEISANPYEILGISPSASQAEIKKQFFHLSKLHHPDRNPKDQAAASRKFVAISDAYRLVGDPAKRERFDRDQQRNSAGHSAPENKGSYGSRAASGLSRRRGAFRGPPPSFYRNGGWGSNTRSRAESASTGASAAGSGASHEESSPGGPYGGSTGSWPFKTDPNDVPHFNREGHYRTTTTIEEQLRKGRGARRSFEESRKPFEDMMEDDSPANIAGRFLMVLGMLTVGIGGSMVLFGGMISQ